jgi:hypothetical protein
MMSDQTSENQRPNAISLSYAGVSSVERGQSGEQRVCLFTNTAEGEVGVRSDLTLHDPLVFREAMRVFLSLHHPKGTYLPDDPKVYEAYVGWRRTLDPLITPVELTQSFYHFLAEHDHEAWVGCDPTVSLNASGLAFESLDPTGRVYAMVNVQPKGYTRLGADQSTGLCAQFEGGETLFNGLSTVNNSGSLTLNVGAEVDDVDVSNRGTLTKSLPAPAEWIRNFTQLLAASTSPLRTVSLSRMDLYNILQQIRLNADVPKQKKGIRFELVPGKAPALTLEPWDWRLVCTGDVYRGERAEILGVWDRRDLLIFDALLPYVDRVELRALGEAQPTFWILHCGQLSFTLATMGFRPNNWSRGVLLDLSLPRLTLPDSVLESASHALSEAGSMSREDLEAHLGSMEEYSPSDIVRSLIQAGLVRPDFTTGRLSARRLFKGFEPQDLRDRNEREGLGSMLSNLGRVKVTLGELPTGEIEVLGEVTQRPAQHLPIEPVYTPRFQIVEGAGMRKQGCDCAWMKDREKQKIGPCAHIIALWIRYSTDEAVRRAELEAHPERVEVATSVYFKRQRGRERSRIIELKRKLLTECWEDQGESPRYFHKVFSDIAAARAAYFKRVAELKRCEYMDASQS